MRELGIKGQNMSLVWRASAEDVPSCENQSDTRRELWELQMVGYGMTNGKVDQGLWKLSLYQK